MVAFDNNIHKCIYKDGFYVSKNLLDTQTMQLLRSELDRYRELNKNPLLSDSEKLRSILFGDKIKNVLHSILGNKLVYCQGYSFNALDFWSMFKWHKDSIDLSKNNVKDWSPLNYPIISGGIYLGDYSKNSGSLGVQPNSHTSSTHSKLGINLKTKPGDVIFWPLTTTHTANSPSFRWNPNRAYTPLLNNNFFLTICHRIGGFINKTPFLIQPQLIKRQVVFFTVGAPSLELAEYLSYSIHRPYFSSMLKEREHESFELTENTQFLNISKFRNKINKKYESITLNTEKAKKAARELSSEIMREFI
jgi:hypothetical protein